MQLHTPGAEASQLCKSSMQVHGVAGVEGKTVKDPVVMYQHSGTRTRNGHWLHLEGKL